MKKSIEKILILILAIILSFATFSINCTYAAEATISVPSVTVGQDFTVTVNIPEEAVAYEGKVSITFSDGTTQTSGKLTKVTGIDGAYSHPGNMTHTFNAAKEGQATIKVTGLVISSKEHKQLNENETLEKTINIEANKPSTPTTPDTPSEPSTPTNPSTPENPSTPDEPTWTKTGDTVYALEDLNVREGWGTSYSKIGSLSKNSSTKRVAVGSNGWDKIDYNGKTGYVLSKYLTTEKPVEDTETDKDDENNKPDETEKEPTWTKTGDTVYALGDLNVREGWGTSYKAIGSLSKNSSTKRVAVGSNGWDKIEYEGKTAYVMSKYLTTEEPKEEIENEVKNQTVENTNIVDNTQEDGEIYNTIVDEVGVIPPVGKNIVDYIYIIAVCIAIAIVSFVGIKIRENNKE